MSRDRNATLDQFLGAGSGDAGSAEADGPEAEPESEAESDPDSEPETEDGPDEPGEAGDVGGDDPEFASAPEAGAVEGADPAEPTYRWTPDRTPCGDCGERVERLWRAGGERSGAFVCASCKDWDRGR